MTRLATRLANRVALVTGAASGMGRASAIALAAEGAQVFMGDINAEGLEDTAKTIRSEGGQCAIRPFDAADPGACNALVDGAVAEFGQLDIVANIAGISRFYSVDELTADIIGQFLTINTISVMTICCRAIPHLRKTQGCIINFASINAKTPIPYHAAYSASKAAVMAATKSMAVELAKDGVRANVISPGSFDTPMNHDFRIPEGADMSLVLARSGAIVRPGQPEEAARVVVFLASDDAGYISGADLTVDAATQASL